MRTFVVTVLVALVAVACGPRGTGAPASPPSTSDPAAGAGSESAPDACATEAGLAEVPPLHPSVDGYPEVRIALVSPGGTCRIELAVRLADSADRRRHGLMEVPDLPAGTGMLFTYPDAPGERTGGYWMKDTLVPLDIAFLAGDGAVVDILSMVPCDDAELDAGDRCPSYTPDHAYRAALEVPAGWFADVGVTEAWRVDAAALRTGP